MLLTFLYKDRKIKDKIKRNKYGIQKKQIFSEEIQRLRVVFHNK